MLKYQPIATVCSVTAIPRSADRSQLNAGMLKIRPVASVLNHAGVPRCAESSLAKARLIVDDYLKKMASIRKSKSSPTKAPNFPKKRNAPIK